MLAAAILCLFFFYLPMQSGAAGTVSIFSDIADGDMVKLGLEAECDIEFTVVALIGESEAKKASFAVQSGNTSVAEVSFIELWGTHIGIVLIHAVGEGNTDISVTADFGTEGVVTNTVHVVVDGEDGNGSGDADREYSEYAFGLCLPEEVSVGEECAGSVRLYVKEEKQLGYDRVTVRVEVVKSPEGVRLPELTVCGEGGMYNAAETGYLGEPDGFSISKDYDETTNLICRFYEEGTYQMRFTLVDESGAGEDILAEQVLSVIVTKQGKRVEAIGAYADKVAVWYRAADNDRIEIRIEKREETVDLNTVHAFIVQENGGVISIKQAQKEEIDGVLLLTADGADIETISKIFIWDNCLVPLTECVTLAGEE